MDPAPLLRELIQAAGRENGTGPLAAAREKLAALDFEVRALPSGEAFVATRGGPRLLFSGHVDVVAAGEGWERAPFGGHEADGRIWGRGAADMLGSVACFLEVAKERRDLPLAVSLTTDEETGMNQALTLVERGMVDGFEACVVGEPTDFQVGIAEKGVLWVRAVARGRAAHASMPHEGDNAIAKLAPAIAALGEPPFRESHPLLGRATAAVTLIRGGVQVNVVPERAELEADHRYLPPHGEADMMSALRARLTEVAPDVRLEIASSHPPFQTDPDAPLAKRALEAVRMVQGASEAVGLPYGTEASRFSRTPMELVILGPGERALAHTNRESVRVADLEGGCRVYERIAEAYAEPRE